MKAKTVKPFSEKERNSIDNNEYLKIEREFHDKHAEHFNWSKPLSDDLSYDRDELRQYGFKSCKARVPLFIVLIFHLNL